MSDGERKHTLISLSSLYSPQDRIIMLAHMPNESTDPTGAAFEDYCNFLQALFKVKASAVYMSREELDEAKLVLLSDANKYGYPTTQFEAL